eukprot:SAG31_NODE_19137_length_611_cov_0.847656_1_plen_94_part_10
MDLINALIGDDPNDRYRYVTDSCAHERTSDTVTSCLEEGMNVRELECAESARICIEQSNVMLVYTLVHLFVHTPAIWIFSFPLALSVALCFGPL